MYFFLCISPNPCFLDTTGSLEQFSQVDALRQSVLFNHHKRTRSSYTVIVTVKLSGGKIKIQKKDRDHMQFRDGGGDSRRLHFLLVNFFFFFFRKFLRLPSGFKQHRSQCHQAIAGIAGTHVSVPAAAPPPLFFRSFAIFHRPTAEEVPTTTT